jgi:16S rRNA processing protein RimM
LKDNWKLVGKIKEAHGLKGELYVLVFSGDVSWLGKLNDFAISTDETAPKQIYKCEKSKPFKNGFILKAVEVTDRNQSEKLKGQLFFVPDDLLKS